MERKIKKFLKSNVCSFVTIFMVLLFFTLFSITYANATTNESNDINNCSVEFDESCYYCQFIDKETDRLRPIIIVKDTDGNILTENVDYIVGAAPTGRYVGKYPLVYEDDTYYEDFEGSMSVTIFGIGNYSGTKKITRDFIGGVKITYFEFSADTFDDCLNLDMFFDGFNNGLKFKSLNKEIVVLENNKENKKELNGEHHHVTLSMKQKSSGKAAFKITCLGDENRAKTIYYLFKDITPNTYISGRKSLSKGSATLEFDCKSNKIFNYVNKKYVDRDYYFDNNMNFDGFVVVGFKDGVDFDFGCQDNGMAYVENNENTFIRYVKLPKTKLNKKSKEKVTKDVKIIKKYEKGKWIDIAFKNLKDDQGSKVDLKLKEGRYHLTLNDLPSGNYCINVYTYKNINESSIDILNKKIISFNRIYTSPEYDNGSLANYIPTSSKCLNKAIGNTSGNVTFDEQCDVYDVLRIK